MTGMEFTSMCFAREISCTAPQPKPARTTQTSMGKKKHKKRILEEKHEDNKKENPKKTYTSEKYYICSTMLGEANKHLWCSAHASQKKCFRRDWRDGQWQGLISKLLTAPCRCFTSVLTGKNKQAKVDMLPSSVPPLLLQDKPAPSNMEVEMSNQTNYVPPQQLQLEQVSTNVTLQWNFNNVLFNVNAGIHPPCTVV